jgi:hypothetical protein
MTPDNQLEVKSANPPEPDAETGGQMTFFEHLVELRKRIIHALAATLIGALIGWLGSAVYLHHCKTNTKGLIDAKLPDELVFTSPTEYSGGFDYAQHLSGDRPGIAVHSLSGLAICCARAVQARTQRNYRVSVFHRLSFSVRYSIRIFRDASPVIEISNWHQPDRSGDTVHQTPD